MISCTSHNTSTILSNLSIDKAFLIDSVNVYSYREHVGGKSQSLLSLGVSHNLLGAIVKYIFWQYSFLFLVDMVCLIVFIPLINFGLMQISLSAKFWLKGYCHLWHLTVWLSLQCNFVAALTNESYTQDQFHASNAWWNASEGYWTLVSFTYFFKITISSTQPLTLTAVTDERLQLHLPNWYQQWTC